MMDARARARLRAEYLRVVDLVAAQVSEQERATIDDAIRELVTAFKDEPSGPLDEQEHSATRARLGEGFRRCQNLLGDHSLDQQERENLMRACWQALLLSSLLLLRAMDERERAEAVAVVQRALAERRVPFPMAELPPAPEIVEAVMGGLVGDFWWVAEAAVYDVEKEGAVLYLTSREQSPILRHPAEAAVALSEDRLFPLRNPDELQAIKTHANTVRVEMAELSLEPGGECCWPLTPVANRLPKSDEPITFHPHFHVETEPGAPPLNPEQGRLAEALFGVPLTRYLDWLYRQGVYQTKVMTASQEDVAEYHERYGPFAMGARFSPVGGDFLLSCNSLLRDIYQACGYNHDPMLGTALSRRKFVFRTR